MSLHMKQRTRKSPSTTHSSQDQGQVAPHLDTVAADNTIELAAYGSGTDDHRAGWDEEFQQSIHGAIESHEHRIKQNELDMHEMRKMWRSNAQVTLKIVILGPDGLPQRQLLVSTTDSLRFGELKKLVQARCGGHHTRQCRLLWLHQSGETIELSQQTLRHYMLAEWCNMPWTVHVHDPQDAPLERILLADMARVLFERFDINRDRTIQRRELVRLFKDLNLEALGCSDVVVENFLQSEFLRLDKDASAGLDLHEFTSYVTSMARWMRQELLVESNAHQIFALLASRAVEVHRPPIAVPPELYVDDECAGERDVYKEWRDDHAVWVVTLGRFGICVEVPTESVIAGASLSLRTLAPSAVSYLSEGDARKQGEFAFTPVVRVDYPAMAEDPTPELTTSAAAMPFVRPLTLVMPHSFDPKEGEESCVMLGAAHGAAQWEAIHRVTAEGGGVSRDDLILDGHMLRATIPYAGTFCGFSSPDVDDIAAVRFHVYSLDSLPRDDPTSLRVHLCPLAPDQQEEVHTHTHTRTSTHARARTAATHARTTLPNLSS